MICFTMNLPVSFSKTVYFIQNWNPTQDAVRTRMYLWMGTLQHSMKFLANISRLELAVYPQGRCRGRFNPLCNKVSKNLLCNKISKLEWLHGVDSIFTLLMHRMETSSSQQNVASDGVDSIFTLLMDRMETMEKGTPHVQLHILRAPAVCSKIR